MAILDDVKTGLGITGNYQDGALNLYIDEVKAFLTDAGVKAETVDSPAAVGVITRGVADLWNYGAGEGALSEYFMQRAIQLKLKDSTTAESGAG
ncbi:phage head-tail connector protein [Ruminococcus sp. 210702-SL.1.03]|uniref:phage head-tail connector protein n=1 Tax=Ruminococcus sp. 210702-SL.1.03 TaxID=2883233 RepID=UPI001D07D95D|nr:phage head-tail connector protein [Ruminococcus sp. 210702-SL.1.03]MCB6616065.1 phage head-tail connector protein [Ruminococcus sp. 210702-SL.1.03]